ncbi:MAG: DUF3379 family protein [Gammaproteobacteria bacterium]|nr:DUF3379 family protein [Gammaproteobacteria bacterium]MDP2139873.1 DUF3379 family protein [Gammaproteobacteria bacterium]MDP2347693.1 DUF3379 family protein [Gammaproteobacteria bacterium]
MDDLEFRKRALANPHDTDEEFIAATSSSTARQQLVQELRMLDSRLSEVLLSAPIPTDLVERLKSRQPRAAAPKTRTMFSRYYALAASLVVAVGVTLSVGLQSARPSAADLQFHDDVLSHVYREAPRYSSNLADLSWQQISQVITEAGGHLREDERIKTLHIKFANDCNIVPATRGAHIVLEGTKGSVSVIIINNSPVTTKFDVTDPRFTGKIIPLGVGNLIIIGEKEEPLESYEALITDAFEWVI